MYSHEFIRLLEAYWHSANVSKNTERDCDTCFVLKLTSMQLLHGWPPSHRSFLRRQLLHARTTRDLFAAAGRSCSDIFVGIRWLGPLHLIKFEVRSWVFFVTKLSGFAKNAPREHPQCRDTTRSGYNSDDGKRRARAQTVH
jgi:hypothetical protein